MLLTYLRRELTRRRRQTALVAIGLALGVALVMVVSSATTGIARAQGGVLDALYGVGTDVRVSLAAESGSSPMQQLRLAAAEGDATTSAAQVVTAAAGSAPMPEAVLADVLAVDGVADAAQALVLTSTTLVGQLPTAPEGTEPGSGTGSGGGLSSGDFTLESYTIEAVDPAAAALGPLSGAQVTDGRGLTAEDADAAVALVSEAFAVTEDLAVGDTVTITGTEVEVVGTVTSVGVEDGLADVYLPLATGQALAGLPGQITDVYVRTDSADQVEAVAAALSTALPEADVATEADLAAQVSGSLGSAANLMSTLGLWLSVVVLAAAFVLAILFTFSGITRRTRELGTLKALGWSNGRIARQVAAESLVQGLLGAAVGIGVGLAGIALVNAAEISLTATTTTAGPSADPSAAESATQAFGGGRRFSEAAAPAVDVTLDAPVDAATVGAGAVLAIAGGLVAGAAGGWRAGRLRPADALRSLD